MQDDSKDVTWAWSDSDGERIITGFESRYDALIDGVENNNGEVPITTMKARPIKIYYGTLDRDWFNDIMDENPHCVNDGTLIRDVLYNVFAWGLDQLPDHNSYADYEGELFDDYDLLPDEILLRSYRDHFDDNDFYRVMKEWGVRVGLDSQKYGRTYDTWSHRTHTVADCVLMYRSLARSVNKLDDYEFDFQFYRLAGCESPGWNIGHVNGLLVYQDGLVAIDHTIQFYRIDHVLKSE